MGRKIKFNFDGITLESEIIKVDRSKLYGSSKKVVRDIKGNECVLSNLYNGDRILPKGSIYFLYAKIAFTNQSDFSFNILQEYIRVVSSCINSGKEIQHLSLQGLIHPF